MKPRRRLTVKRAFANAMTYSLLLTIPACGIPHLRKADPGPDEPATYPDGLHANDSGENSAEIPVIDFFDDPHLVGLIEQAMVGNQELRMLAQDIEISSNEVLSRSGAFLPFISLGGGASLDKPGEFTRGGAVDSQLDIRPGQAIPTPLPNYFAAADISWQIDIWRMLRNSRDAAGMRYLATIEGRNYVVTRLIAEIAENYYTLMALDKRLENLERTIALQEQSLDIAEALKNAARGTELGVRRFQAEVQKNQSERLIIKQEIVVVENRINFLVGRYPQPVERNSTEFFDLSLQELKVGFPAQLLQNRPDIRQAEREIQASGLDIRVARARFYPAVVIRAGVGYEAFDMRYLFQSPDSLAYNVAGSLVAPLINKRAIQADFLTANARQLQAIYDYQRTVLNAFTEVVNQVSKVENYRQSIEIKQQQLQSLEASVEVATRLFQGARAEYMDVLFAQRDLMEARMSLIDTKKEQLAAVVNAYQALGGGWRDYMDAHMPAPHSEEFAPIEILVDPLPESDMLMPVDPTPAKQPMQQPIAQPPVDPIATPPSGQPQEMPPASSEPAPAEPAITPAAKSPSADQPVASPPPPPSANPEKDEEGSPGTPAAPASSEPPMAKYLPRFPN